MDQLNLYIADQLIKRRDSNNRIKQKTVTNLTNITGINGGPRLALFTLIHRNLDPNLSTTNSRGRYPISDQRN